MKQKIVITGAPGTGKTSIIQHLEASGFSCLHEIIRSMTLKAKKNTSNDLIKSNPLAFVSDPLEFNKSILNGRVDQYIQADSIEKPVVFFDRAIPDVLAYMDFFKQSYDHQFTDACSDHTYNQIFILPPWKEIYISDNERFESFEEALQIHHHLDHTYRNFGYKPIEVPLVSVEERTDFILKQLKIQ